MHVVYRVHASNDAYFHYQVHCHQLSTATLLISDGASDNYGLYMNPDVKVYYIKSTTVNLQALENDLKLNPPTNATFTVVGASEFYI